jgi:hypothetical protein
MKSIIKKENNIPATNSRKKLSVLQKAKKIKGSVFYIEGDDYFNKKYSISK